MSYIYLDESGDLGFDWSKPGTSEFFTVTLLICESKTAADKIKQAIKKTIRNKLNSPNPKRNNKELKGTRTSIQVKKYFYEKIKDHNFSIYSVSLNKKRLNINLQTKIGKKKMYNFLARFILEKVDITKLTTHKYPINFIVDRCKNKEEIKDFNQYIENHLQAILPLDIPLNIEHESSDETPCLQAVDLFCWGIQRKYTSKDLEWYNFYKNKIKYDEIYLP